jgi:arginyl-tRNA synthetase
MERLNFLRSLAEHLRRRIDMDAATYLKNQLSLALQSAFGAEYAAADPLLVPASNPQFGDYQANVAMGLAKKLGQAPRSIAQQIVDKLDVSAVCVSPNIAGPGFINFQLAPAYLAEQIRSIHQDPRLGVATVAQPQRIVVDFSSPNIAKEMHVGHLRSTIIGDCIARVLEFRGHEVLRLNHVGDWGTQFGMLICYLQEVYPSALDTADVLDIGDLVTFYKQAKVRFDTDEAFQAAARQQVVELQAGNELTIKAWKLLCEQSRREFQMIYDRLGIRLTERGESFYNPYLAETISELESLNLVEVSEGAKCIFTAGFTNREGEPLPLIIQKSDGGYNYATTDLAAVRYRMRVDRADRVIYITDAGQANHFAQFFQVAHKAHWIPASAEVVHVPFGLVQGEDGKKLKTRSGETIKLKALLDEAIDRSQQDLTQRLAAEERTETAEFIQHTARTTGLGAVKYADLSQNRLSNYIFSFDKMLALQGNTAPYMLYAYVRVQGIGRKGNIDWSAVETTQVVMTDESEQVLAKHLLQLDTTLAEIERDLYPNRLCQYLFELSQKFNQFFDRCPVLTAENEESRMSRLILCDLTARTLKLGLGLLGIEVLDRM